MITKPERQTLLRGRTLILASGSPRRRALLSRHGITHSVATVNVDETVLENEAAATYVRRLALAKAVAAATAGGDALVLGADTAVVDGDEILGKPERDDVAREFLRRLRGRRHTVLTGIAVVDERTGLDVTEVVRTAVWLRHFDDTEMEAYIETGDPLDKAGGYGIQHPTFRPVATLRGSETNVIGLPLDATRRLLGRAIARSERR